MSNNRVEMEMSKCLSVRIATAAACVIKAEELFKESKAILDSAGSFDDQAPLTGLTVGKAEELYTIISNACVNVGTAKVEMSKIDQGIEI